MTPRTISLMWLHNKMNSLPPFAQTVGQRQMILILCQAQRNRRSSWFLLKPRRGIILLLFRPTYSAALRWFASGVGNLINERAVNCIVQKPWTKRTPLLNWLNKGAKVTGISVTMKVLKVYLNGLMNSQPRKEVRIYDENRINESDFR